jgi:hypothetical protein
MIRGAGALERKTTMGATASPSGCVEVRFRDHPIGGLAADLGRRLPLAIPMNDRPLAAVTHSRAAVPVSANRPMVRLDRDMPTVDPMRPRRGDEDDGIDANLFRRTKPPQRKSVPQRARPG